MKITNLKYFLIGFIIGIVAIALSWGQLKNSGKELKSLDPIQTWQRVTGYIKFIPSYFKFYRHHDVEKFNEPVKAVSGSAFGDRDQLTFELFRNGVFVIDGNSGYALQKSDSYRDSSWIRSTDALPSEYKVSVLVGGIDYGLEKIFGLSDDPEYPEGPKKENGCYLLVITDTKPEGHHINDWWHHHRKVGVDVDNNVWGSGMPRPVFMVYSDTNNKIGCLNGATGAWSKEWVSGIHYELNQWYWVEVEKTRNRYNLSVKSENGKLLQRASVDIKDVWHGQGDYQEYFVIGDPHENYYQGSMKIKEISIRY